MSSSASYTAETTLYPLTSSQREIWFDQLLHPELPLYNVGGYVKLAGTIDPDLFQQAIALLVQKHDALRLVLTDTLNEDGVPMQQFLPQVSVTVEMQDFSQAENPEAAALAWMQAQFIAPFDLQGKPLFRYKLLKCSETLFYIFIKYHHIMFDGWAGALLNKSLADIYSKLSENKFPPIEAPSYVDFIQQDLDYIGSKTFIKNRHYWQEEFSLPTESLLKSQNLSDKDYSSCESLYLSHAFYQKLASLAHNHQVSIFHVFLGVLTVYFSRVSQKQEVIFGLPIQNRANAQFKNTVGLFTGISPALFSCHLSSTFVALIQQISKKLKANYRHQRCPVSEIGRAVGLNIIHERLYDISVSYEKHDHNFSFGKTSGYAVNFLNNASQTPLTLFIREFHRNQDIKCDFVFNHAFFTIEDIKAFQSRFLFLLEQVLAQAELPIAQLSLLTPTEIEQLQQWNNTTTDYPKDKTIVDLFEQQVKATPNNTAVIFQDQGLTYAQLNEKANQLAHFLKEQYHIQSDTLIGICIERSLEMVIGLLGILKAGGAYVPLDPNYPQQRLAWMLEDSRVSVLLTQTSLQNTLPEHQVDILCLDNWERFAQQSIENLKLALNPESLAYVIYTSGSTGKPKGCLITHHNVTRLYKATDSIYQFNDKDVWTLFHSYAFDFSVWELWGALLYGGQLLIVPYWLSRSPSDFHTFLTQHQVTVLNQTPSAFRQLIDADQQTKTRLNNLRHVIFGGEALEPAMLQAWFEKYAAHTPTLSNMYGITETTVHVTYCYISPDFIYGKSVVGQPLADLSVYVLDANKQVMPIGVAGEMYVAGDGLARGYLNRPDLTAEKFVELELFGKTERVYKTGDLARWLPDGNLEYLGRIDHQIKLRGFRIELGEIEAVLTQQESIKDAVVILHEKDGNKSLAAYLVLANKNADIGGLREALKAKLPDYMLPSYFTILDKLPLTPNGKIDRKALPEPDLINTSTENRPLRNETDHLLANLWSEVLRCEINSRAVNFFELGGHSLLATQLIARIRHNFEIEIPLRQLFDKPVLSDFSDWLIQQQRGTTLPAIIPQTDKQTLVMSYAQQRLWFLAQLEGESATYNMPATLQLTGDLDLEKLQQSLISLVARHQSLRLSFPSINGEASVIELATYNPLTITDLTHLPEIEQQAQIQHLAQQHASKPFNLAQGKLLQVELLKLSADNYVLLFNMHHIISDGWSMGVLIREWMAFYSNPETQLKPLSINYTDYATWQRNWLSGEILQQQLHYWQNQLANAPELLELPTDFSRPAMQSYRGNHLQTQLSKELSQNIQQFSQKNGCTVFMTLLSAFNVLLHRYSGQNDILIGSPIANRTQQQTEELIGFFVNTLVLRTQIDANTNFNELLTQTRHSTLAAYAHQDTPFEQVVEAVNPTRTLSHAPLFQVMFVLQNTPDSTNFQLPNLSIKSLAQENLTAKFDLTLSVSEQEGHLDCSWEYATDLFQLSTIERLSHHFAHLLTQLLQAPELPIYRHQLLTPTEIEQLQHWNNTAVNYPKDKTIVDLFEQQVKATPNNIAVVFQEESLTYVQLNEKANQLAHFLKNQYHVQSDTLIGICIERSLEMVIGLLGILKAGGAYVPLDPNYPQQRLAWMLEDSCVSVLLTQTSLQNTLPEHQANILCLDNWERFAQQSTKNLDLILSPESLAYVIYTSGSTGKPKGAINHHRGLQNRLLWMQSEYRLTSNDKVLQKTPFSFDVSVWEFFWPLITGAQLVVAKPLGHQDPNYLLDLIEEMRISVLHFVPSMLSAFIEVITINHCSSLRHIICSGEALPLELMQRTYHYFYQTQLHNLYGPTEAAIDVTAWRCDLNIKNNIVPIGQPIANTQVYILNAHNQCQPIGITGELHIGGVQVGNGYLNRPDLTAEKFVELEIFGKTERVYKTGDLARWLPDGNLEYLGRIDHQIKLRGFRIELGEIEAVLTQQELVKDAVVILHEKDGNKSLAAYLVLADKNADISSLREALKAKLPDYMLPSYFTILDKLPLTPNGKIDRKALPEPEQILSTADFIMPRNETEQQLAIIWQTLLKRQTISVHDNFFELGGDSILSLQIVARARQAGLGISPRDVFQHQTIAELAAVQVQPLAVITAEQGLLQGDVPLHPIQTYFLNAQYEEAWHFNQAVLIKIPNTLDNAALKRALHYLISHHDALRLCYQLSENNWQQYYRDEIENTPSYHQETLINLNDLAQRATDWQTSLNLQTGPITRLVRFDCGSESRLLWCIHHLAVDGVSWRILLEDLANAYQQAVEQQPIQLPAKTSSVRAWNQHLQNWHDADRAYWQQLPTLQVAYPIDYLTPRLTQHHNLCLDSNWTQRLLDQAPAAYRTRINDLLLTALMQTLQAWTGQHEHLIDLESHGRNHELFPDLDLTRTVGWFTALYSVPLNLPNTTNLGTQLKAIKEQLRQIPHDGIGYGVLRYLQQQDLPQGQVLFNYLGQMDAGNTPDNLFQLTQESTGQSVSDRIQSEHILDINGSIINGQLNLTFSSGYLSHNSLEKVSQSYQQHLTALIEHCQYHSGYTPSDFLLANLTQTQLDELAQQYPQNIAAIYPLTPMQAGMLFHSLYAPDSDTYITQLQIEIAGQLDAKLLKQAWEILVDRHAILRTAFLTEYTPPLQLVLQQVKLPWLELEDSENINAARQQAKARCTDFNQAPLMHLTLQRHNENDYTLYWDSHHVLTDGWCLPILFEELFRSYQALRQGKQAQLPPVRPYQDYIRWLVQQDSQAAEAYWTRKLQGFEAPTPLPQKFSTSNIEGSQGIVNYSCSPALSECLTQRARQHRVTLNILVQAAWALLLSRYSGQQDIVFGATSAGRHAPVVGIERMIGLFINTLPVRVQLDNLNLTQLLQQLQQQQQQDQHYAYTPLAEIQRWSEVPNGIALFDSILVFENYPVDEQALSEATQTLQIKNVNSIEQTNYPLTLAVHAKQQLHFRLSYQSEKFDAAQMERLLQHLANLLEGISQADSHTQPQQLPLLTSTEIEQLQQWNNTTTDYPKDKTIVDLFEQQVKATPNNTAVIFQAQSLTYVQLNEKANQLAHFLKNQYHVQSDTLIGICIERSLEMVIGLLGILKAGGAYVPLDPNYPQERLAWMLEDSRVSVLLTQTSLQNTLPEHQADILCLDNWERFAQQSTKNLELALNSDSLAYVLFTSGSTGRPKGVMIEHQALHNFLHDMQLRLQSKLNSYLLAVTTLSFDIAGLELYLPLLTGMGIVLTDRETASDGEKLQVLLQQYDICLMQATPATWKLLLDNNWQQNRPLTILCGGEALPENLGQALLQQSEQLWNVYGPTETTIWSSAHNATQSPEQPSLIGKPLSNTRIHIVDTQNHPVPIGIAGELCIAGDGLARGYLNRPDLTAEKFVELELFGKTERVYKTGDLARWLPDGNLDYLGRIDHQVKLRGFRIELGEIEAILTQQESIKDAIVILHEKDGNKSLAAYLVLADKNADISDLREVLKVKLPDYMVPTYFTILDKLPLTPNGKIDRKALPEPEKSHITSNQETPRNQAELQLIQTWQKVLNIQKIGIRDNFFELGGHSLLAVQLMSHIQQHWQQKLPLAVLFSSPTIAQLAQHLQQNNTQHSCLVPIQIQGSQPPLYCLPGAGGHVLYLHALACHLGIDQPLYGLETPGLHGECPMPDSVEQHAALLLQAIRKQQPNGPYRFAGHSAGGRVALALAHQLEKQGEKIQCLIILDTTAPQINPEPTAELTEVEALWSVVKIVEELKNTQIDLTEAEIAAESDSYKRYEQVMEHVQIAGMFAPQTPVEELKHLVAIYQTMIRNHAYYRPNYQINCPIILVKAKEIPNETERPNSLDWGWQLYSTQTVQIIETSGGHITMLTQPYVAELASLLTQAMANTMNKNTQENLL